MTRRVHIDVDAAARKYERGQTTREIAVSFVHGCTLKPGHPGDHGSYMMRNGRDTVPRPETYKKVEAVPSNAWSSADKAPGGAVEHKMPENTVFICDLEKHRREIHSMLNSRGSSDNVVSDAIWFLLAVAHQPLPVDVVPVDAVRERFEGGGNCDE